VFFLFLRISAVTVWHLIFHQTGGASTVICLRRHALGQHKPGLHCLEFDFCKSLSPLSNFLWSLICPRAHHLFYIHDAAFLVSLLALQFGLALGLHCALRILNRFTTMYLAESHVIITQRRGLTWRHLAWCCSKLEDNSEILSKWIILKSNDRQWTIGNVPKFSG